MSSQCDYSKTQNIVNNIFICQSMNLEWCFSFITDDPKNMQSINTNLLLIFAMHITDVINYNWKEKNPNNNKTENNKQSLLLQILVFKWWKK